MPHNVSTVDFHWPLCSAAVLQIKHLICNLAGHNDWQETFLIGLIGVFANSVQTIVQYQTAILCPEWDSHIKINVDSEEVSLTQV